MLKVGAKYVSKYLLKPQSRKEIMDHWDRVIRKINLRKSVQLDVSKDIQFIGEVDSYYKYSAADDIGIS